MEVRRIHVAFCIDQHPGGVFEAPIGRIHHGIPAGIILLTCIRAGHEQGADSLGLPAPSGGPPRHGPPKVLSQMSIGAFQPSRSSLGGVENVTIRRIDDDDLGDEEVVKI